MGSNYTQDHNRLFENLTAALNRDLARLSTEANGGRSILFVYPPEDEVFLLYYHTFPHRLQVARILDFLPEVSFLLDIILYLLYNKLICVRDGQGEDGPDISFTNTTAPPMGAVLP